MMAKKQNTIKDFMESRFLYDAMTKNSDNKGFYDFKNLSAMKSTFDFYMNPLLGRVEFVNSGETIPSTLDDWTNFVTNQANSNVSDFIDSTIVDETKKYSIILDPVFSAFETGLNSKTVLRLKTALYT